MVWFFIECKYLLVIFGIYKGEKIGISYLGEVFRGLGLWMFLGNSYV